MDLTKLGFNRTPPKKAEPQPQTQAPPQPQTQAPLQPQTQAPPQPQTQVPRQPQTQAPTQQSQQSAEDDSLRVPLVSDLMTTDLFTLGKDDNLKTVEDMMKWRAIRHIPVVDDDYRVVGLVTHRDLLKYSISGFANVGDDEKEALNKSIPVASIMKTNIQTIQPKTSLQDAAKMMLKYKFGCLLITENEKLVGIITEADFMKFFVDREVFSE